MASDLIYREDAKVFVRHACYKKINPIDYLDEVPAADVVACDCYDRILAENDTMREQLAEVGKKIGDTMDDVRPVVRARWEDETGYIFAGLAQRVYCPACKSYAYFYPGKTKNFCPTCGADMRPDKNGQTGEKNRG